MEQISKHNSIHFKLPFIPKLLTGMVFTGWILFLLLIWNMAPALIPSPERTASELLNYITDQDFYLDVISSLLLALFGLLFSIIISCLLVYSSCIYFVYRHGEDTKIIYPFKFITDLVIKFRYLSIMGFLFTFAMLLHDASKIKMALLMFGIIPFFTQSLRKAIDSIDTREYDFWTTLKFNKWERLWHIIIRGKAENTVWAIRENFAMGWIMIIFAESYSMCNGGLGVLLYKANHIGHIDQVFAVQLCILTIGMFLDLFLKYSRYWLFPHTALAEKD